MSEMEQTEVEDKSEVVEDSNSIGNTGEKTHSEDSSLSESNISNGTKSTVTNDTSKQHELELENISGDSEIDSESQSDSNSKKDLASEDLTLEINQEEFKKLKSVLEALLMASDKPLTLKGFTDILNTYNEDHNTRVKDRVKFNKRYLNLALDELNTDYEDRAFEIKLLGSGYRIQTRPDYAHWVQGLWQEKPGRYSKATLETLAIIAYRQPITRGEIEHIRGVAVSSHIIRNLLDRDWIKVVGHRELPGRPAIYATTLQFLADLNLEKLEDLPTLADIKEIKQDLFSGLAEMENPLAKNSEHESDQNTEQTPEIESIEEAEDSFQQISEEISNTDTEIVDETRSDIGMEEEIDIKSETEMV